jgi:hypothetical protein
MAILTRWCYTVLLSSLGFATPAFADCISDVCPQYQGASAFDRFARTVNTAPCATVGCLRAWQKLPSILMGSTNPSDIVMDNIIDAMQESQGIATQNTIDNAILDDFIQQNSFGGQSPYWPNDVGGVGTIYNTPVSGTPAIDTGAGVIYNSPN